MIKTLPFNGNVKIIIGYIPNFKSIQQQLVEAIDHSDDVQKHKTNLKCKMTDWRIHHTYDTCKHVSQHVKTHIQQHQKKEHRSNHKITVTEFWGAHYTDTGKAIKHTHYPALWSGVLYVKLEGKCSPTEFNNCDYAHFPKEGEYIIFPGWLKHSVKSGSGNRYVCAFNMRALNIENGRH